MGQDTLTLLIVDDEPADHTIYLEYLGGSDGHNYRFLHAYTGEEGVRMYRQQHVDCVLLDYRMPDMDGLEVLQRLTVDDRIVPIIMMAGEGDAMIAVTAMKLGSQDYIPKQVVTPAALKHAVERAAERSELLHRMEAYRADLERSNHDLEHFVSIVAHDLKAPLRAVAQHLKLIEEKNAGKLDERSRQSLLFAVDGAERMRALIDALFVYARLGFSKPSVAAVDLNEVLAQVKRDLEADIQEAGAVITADTLPTVSGDSLLLSQLLQNLIGNALKYCEEKPHVHVGARPEDGRWLCFVRDNGIGIAPEHHEPIFTIFRRLHRQEEYAGIGLGLAVCDRVVRQHGGRIWVQSTLGEGATFYWTLPPAEAIEQRKAAYG